MSKDEMKRQRRIVMAKMDALNDRAAAGEDVAEELLACGKELGAIGKKTPRVNVMDATKTAQGKRVTKELLKRAAANGIPSSTVQNRVYSLDWDPERAATEKQPQRYPQGERITVDSYHEMKNNGLMDKEVAKACNMSLYSLYKFKGLNGLKQSYEKAEQIKGAMK